LTGASSRDILVLKQKALDGLKYWVGGSIRKMPLFPARTLSAGDAPRGHGTIETLSKNGRAHSQFAPGCSVGTPAKGF
jgi:hypothetical protein